MIKETLIKLLEKDLSPIINKNTQYLLENFDESQLEILLAQGVSINNNIKLYYYIGSGYRCMNERVDLYGRNPLCVIIEKYLNKELLNI